MPLTIGIYNKKYSSKTRLLQQMLDESVTTYCSAEWGAEVLTGSILTELTMQSKRET